MIDEDRAECQAHNATHEILRLRAQVERMRDALEYMTLFVDYSGSAHSGSERDRALEKIAAALEVKP